MLDGLVAIRRAVEHREARVRADVVGKLAQLLLEFRFRFRIAIEPRVRVPEIQMQVPRASLPACSARRRGFLERRQRILVPAVVVGEPAGDELRHRQVWIRLLRPSPRASFAAIASSRARATRAAISCAAAFIRASAPASASGDGLIRLHGRVVHAARVEQRRRERQRHFGIIGTPCRNGTQRLDGFVDAPSARQQRRDLILHAHKLGMFCRNGTQRVERGGVALLCDQHDRCPVRCRQRCLIVRQCEGAWCDRCEGSTGRRCRTKTLKISERGEPIFVRLRRWCRRVDGMSLRAACRARPSSGRSERIRVRRVGHERLQLLTDAAHEPVRGIRQRKQRLPVEPELRRQQLGVDRLIRHEAAGLVENRAQRSAAKPRRHRRAHQIEQRRQQVDVLHG